MERKGQKFYVEERSSVVSTLTETETLGGSGTSDGGIICLEKSTNNWIMIGPDDERICNRDNDCKNGLCEQRDGKDCQRDDSAQPDIATRVDEEKPKTPPTQHDPTQSKPNPPTSKPNPTKPNTSGPTVLTPITEKPKRTNETNGRVATDIDNKQEPNSHDSSIIYELGHIPRN